MNGTLANGLTKGTLAITWVPNPNTLLKRMYSPGKQLDACKWFMDQLHKCTIYQMYPEMTIAGNIHFHGLIEITDKVKWYKSVQPTLKRNGFVLIKSNVDQGWIDYIRKDMEDMKTIFKIDLPISKPFHKLKKDKTKEEIEQDIIDALELDWKGISHFRNNPPEDSEEYVTLFPESDKP